MNKLQLYARCFLTGLLLLAGGCGEPPRQSDWQSSGKTMGTGFSVQIAQCGAQRCDDELAGQISQRLQQLDAQYSHYLATSELSRFNQHRSDEWFKASDEFVEIVQLAQSVSLKSDGAFDITVGQAVNAWGFGPGEPTLPPAESVLRDARTHSGYKKLESRLTPATLRKSDPDITMDLSAIVKGYAADQIAYLLEFADINNYVIDIGGDLRLAGFRSDGKPWRVGIESPDDGLKINYILNPGDNAVATSGDYRNFYIADGRRISHTIDPENSAPVTHQLSSVTVIDPLAANADAWATALMVMGPEDGFDFAAQAGIPALFLTRTSDGPASRLTSEMQPYLHAP